MNITETTATTATAPVVESVPSLWVDSRDPAFFRITAELFTHEFVFGAGVLLASYDDERAA
jgi:hypothetical protein